MLRVPLSRGAEALIDDADAERVLPYKWHCLKVGYAARSVTAGDRRSIVLMHRWIANAPAGMYVDHINGDKLDNRRENLRICTPHQSVGNIPPRNGKRFKGVMFDRREHNGRKWSAYIRRNGRTVILGRFATEEDAARAYDRAAREYFGAFAWLNFPADSDRQCSKQTRGRPAEAPVAKKVA